MNDFTMIVKGGNLDAINFGENAMVTISKGTLLKRPPNNLPVTVTIKYTAPPDGYFNTQSYEKSEMLCSFDLGKNEVEIESMYCDYMNPKITVPEGSDVKLVGYFTSMDIFTEKEPEEESVSTETPEDEEDGDFQEEESDM